ncbi:MAG TPA: xanthine dehydrogenase molybdopterin binding subunit, partial [Rhodanobacteraceae bacterium]|nr:xanthine dehydrogenase molybdopterin binding subunit [Rhodanobacteraceae bacterium]
MNDSDRELEAATARIVGEPVRHESAHLHVSGRAIYTDDIALPPDTLHAAFGISRIAHGRFGALDLTPVLAAPGVVAVAVAGDIPGENNYGGIIHDDPIFADGLVQYAGQPIFAVAANSCNAARRAAARANVEYTELPAILDVRAAVAAGNFVVPTKHMSRGQPQAALEGAPRRLS